MLVHNFLFIRIFRSFHLLIRELTETTISPLSFHSCYFFIIELAKYCKDSTEWRKAGVPWRDAAQILQQRRKNAWKSERRNDEVDPRPALLILRNDQCPHDKVCSLVLVGEHFFNNVYKMREFPSALRSLPRGCTMVKGRPEIRDPERLRISSSA